MRQVNEQLNFMWRERLAEYFHELQIRTANETKGFTPYSDKMDSILTTLNIMGLTVKGIEV